MAAQQRGHPQRFNRGHAGFQGGGGGGGGGYGGRGGGAMPVDFIPGSASLCESLDRDILVVLRDGRHLVGKVRVYSFNCV